MPKRDLQRLENQIREMAQRLIQGEEDLTAAELGEELRRSGIDPEKLKQRFYEAVREIATRERSANRPAPLSLQQAIDQFAPDEIVPRDEKTAVSRMTRWLGRLSAPLSLRKEELKAAHAYRKAGEISEDDKADLDELEKRLKDEIQGEDDAKS